MGTLNFADIAFRMGGFWGVAACFYLLVVVVLLVVCQRRRGVVAALGALIAVLVAGAGNELARRLSAPETVSAAPSATGWSRRRQARSGSAHRA